MELTSHSNASGTTFASPKSSSSKITRYFQPATRPKAFPEQESALPRVTDKQEQQHSSQAPEIFSEVSPTAFQPLQRDPPNISVYPITPETLPSFRRIITLLLPIRYPESFFAESIHNTNSSSLARVAVWEEKAEPRRGISDTTTNTSTSSDDRSSTCEQKDRGEDLKRLATVVAGIQCRLEPLPASFADTRVEQQCYIQTLALLSPYRSKGIAIALLNSIIKVLLTHPQYDSVRSLYAHVWEANVEALEWYRRRGFTVEEGVIEGYYRKLKPNTAKIVRRRIGIEDYLGHQLKR